MDKKELKKEIKEKTLLTEQRIKEIKFDNKEYVKKHLTKDGKFRVEINLSENDNVFEKFSSKDDPKISHDIINYINEEVYYIHTFYEVEVVFKGREFSEKEQEKIKHSLIEYYSLKVFDARDDKKRNRIKSYSLLFIGIVLITAYIFISLMSVNKLFIELLSIIGSFAIWEGVDFLLLENVNINKKILNQKQLAFLDVKFEK